MPLPPPLSVQHYISINLNRTLGPVSLARLHDTLLFPGIKHIESTIRMMLLLLAGDVELNPGPVPSTMCGVFTDNHVRYNTSPVFS